MNKHRKSAPSGETYKAHARRVREGWFEKYAPDDKPGIDIGPASDPLNMFYRRWELHPDGDATHMAGVPDGVYHTVYASHVLEHVRDPVTAVRNWYRITSVGGHVIICVPHRNLYEKRTELPSRWNHDHKFFWLPENDEPPCTLSFKRVIREAVPQGELVSFRVLDEGYVSNGDGHSGGEYSIEAIIRRAA